MKGKSLNWETLIAQVSAETTPLSGEPPFGLATRVVAAWRVARRDEGLRRWTFWSLRAALGSLAVCALILAISSSQEDPPVLLQPPTSQFVTPSFLNQ